MQDSEIYKGITSFNKECNFNILTTIGFYIYIIEQENIYY